jgi:hypothetical protein
LCERDPVERGVELAAATATDAMTDKQRELFISRGGKTARAQTGKGVEGRNERLAGRRKTV